MARFLAIRLSLIVLTLLLVSVAIFIAGEVLPGDACTKKLGRFITPESYRACMAEWDLDRSAAVRYLDWIAGVDPGDGSGGVILGDFGYSFNQLRPVTDVIGHRFWYSVTLAVIAFLAAVPTAVLVGVWAGVRPDSVGDRIVSAFAMVGISLPEFVTGVLLILIFASTLDLLPTLSTIGDGETPLTNPKILVMPILTLTAVVFAYIMRMTRANVIEVMQSNYVRTAILKGIPMRRVVFRHAVPNALLPTISVVAQMSGWLLAGLIIVETVFAYPGLGSLLLASISSDDQHLLQGLVLIIAGAYTIGNLVADLLYAYLDPRIRYA